MQGGISVGFLSFFIYFFILFFAVGLVLLNKLFDRTLYPERDPNADPDDPDPDPIITPGSYIEDMYGWIATVLSFMFIFFIFVYGMVWFYRQKVGDLEEELEGCEKKKKASSKISETKIEELKKICGTTTTNINTSDKVAGSGALVHKEYNKMVEPVRPISDQSRLSTDLSLGGKNDSISDIEKRYNTVRFAA